MKNQYFGDVGDYGKYGLLRFIASNGIHIAVNWYLTKNDHTNDGNKREYLKNDKNRIYDSELFDVLKRMCVQDDEKDVSRFASYRIIPHAVYYDEIVEPKLSLSFAERKASRQRWHMKALTACNDASLVFLDPDNGLRAGTPSARKDAPKYAYASEVKDYYDRHQDIVYYCHKGRRTKTQWEKAKRIMADYCSDAALMGVTYHKGTQRSYIFVVHPERERMYADLLKEFLKTTWKECFTEESFSYK